MTTTEHLLLIESKCEANLDYLQLCRSGGALITKIDLLAEAGWKSTLAAIEWVTQFSQVDLSPCDGGSCMVATEVDERLDSIRQHAVAAILAAWPIELLQ
jgi:hypothetical protein